MISLEENVTGNATWILFFRKFSAEWFVIWSSEEHVIGNAVWILFFKKIFCRIYHLTGNFEMLLELCEYYSPEKFLQNRFCIVQSVQIEIVLELIIHVESFYRKILQYRLCENY